MTPYYLIALKALFLQDTTYFLDYSAKNRFLKIFFIHFSPTFLELNLNFNIPVPQRIEESPGITETSIELPSADNLFSTIDKIAITLKVATMSATYHGHGAWITLLGTKEILPLESITINDYK